MVGMNDVKVCPECRGEGTVRRWWSFFWLWPLVCDNCEGTGRVEPTPKTLFVYPRFPTHRTSPPPPPTRREEIRREDTIRKEDDGPDVIGTAATVAMLGGNPLEAAAVTALTGSELLGAVAGMSDQNENQVNPSEQTETNASVEDRTEAEASAAVETKEAESDTSESSVEDSREDTGGNDDSPSDSGDGDSGGE